MNRLYVTIHLPKVFSDAEARSISNEIHKVLNAKLIELGGEKAEEILYEGQLRKAVDSKL